MSLEEKLAKLAGQRQLEKTEAVRQGQGEKLRPVRENLQRLAEQKYSLELIAGSLAMRSSSAIGKGMREYKADVVAEQRERGEKLESIIEGHKDVLSEMRIASREDLLAHEELGSEPEALSYKESLEKTERISESDLALSQRLESLGVRIEAGDFSYESTEKAVADRLAELNEEIVREKMKTPEGRQEVVTQLAEKLQRSLPPTEFYDGSERDQSHIMFKSTGARDATLSLSLITFNRTAFDNWSELRMPTYTDPAIVEASKYGKHVMREVIQEAYRRKVDVALGGSEKIESVKHLKSLDDKAHKLTDLAVEARLITQELEIAVGKNGMRLDPSHPMESYRAILETISQDKQRAVEALAGLMKMSEIFPKEEALKVEDGIILAPRIRVQNDKFYGELEKLRREMWELRHIGENDLPERIKDIERRISQHEKEAPRLFRGKWEKEHLELTNNLEMLRSLQGRIESLKQERREDNIRVPGTWDARSGEANSGVGLMLRKLHIEGTEDQILSRLCDATQKYIETETQLPSEVTSIYNRLEKAVKGLEPIQSYR